MSSEIIFEGAFTPLLVFISYSRFNMLNQSFLLITKEVDKLNYIVFHSNKFILTANSKFTKPRF